MRGLRRKKRCRLCADGPARNVRFRVGSEACQLSFTRFPENHGLQNPRLIVMPSLSGGMSGPRKGITLPAIHAALGTAFRISVRSFRHRHVLSGTGLSFQVPARPFGHRPAILGIARPFRYRPLIQLAGPRVVPVIREGAGLSDSAENFPHVHKFTENSDTVLR